MASQFFPMDDTYFRLPPTYGTNFGLPQPYGPESIIEELFPEIAGCFPAQASAGEQSENRAGESAGDSQRKDDSTIALQAADSTAASSSGTVPSAATDYSCRNITG